MDAFQDTNITTNGSQLTEAHLAVGVNDTSAFTPEAEMDSFKTVNLNWHTEREALVSIVKEISQLRGEYDRVVARLDVLEFWLKFQEAQSKTTCEGSQVPTEEQDEEWEPDVEDSVVDPTVLIARRLQSEGTNLQQWYGVSPETIGAIGK